MSGEPQFSTGQSPTCIGSAEQTRVGFGREHPELRALLTSLTSSARASLRWTGNIRLEAASYLTEHVPPDVVISSIRGLVVVDRALVACRSPQELHVWPGGRREAGEDHLETLRREVLEETGWQIDTETARYLGFVAYRYTVPQPADHPYPNPDFTQLIFTCSTTGYVGNQDQPWHDTDGWEYEALTVTMDALAEADLNELQRPYVNSLISQGLLD